MKKVVKLTALIYFCLGSLYALTMGMNTAGVSYAGNTEHPFHIDHVISAHYNDKALILCAETRNAYSDALGEPAILGIVVPVKALWENSSRLEEFYRPSWYEHGVYMPHRQLTTHCDLPDNSYMEITIVRLPFIEPGKYIDGFSKYELGKLIETLNHEAQLLEIPTSFTGERFSKHKQIVFVHTEQDWQGYKFLDIHLKSIFTDPDNQWHHYLWAFMKDTLSFPYQIVMWVIYAGAH